MYDLLVDLETRFSKKNVGFVAAVMLIGLVSLGSSAAGADPILTLNGGVMDANGNDITDGGATIWDASNSYIPAAQINDGSGSGLDADTLDGNSPGQIQSGTTASDVGLGNVENENSLAEDGSENMGGDLNIGDNDITNVNSISGNSQLKTAGIELFTDQSGASGVGSGPVAIEAFDISCCVQPNSGDSDVDLSMDSDGDIAFQVDSDGSSGGSYSSYFSATDGSLNLEEGGLNLHGNRVDGVLTLDGNTDQDLDLRSDSGISLITDLDGTSGECRVDSDQNINCDGSKNWIHSLNTTHDSYYTSQESPQVRAVYEGKADVEGRTQVELPSHFSATVSNTEPMLRATATVQGELAYAAVIEKTDDYLVLDSSEPATVNYRVTGIREGYEDKQVVRPTDQTR